MHAKVLLTTVLNWKKILNSCLSETYVTPSWSLLHINWCSHLHNFSTRKNPLLKHVLDMGTKTSLFLQHIKNDDYPTLKNKLTNSSIIFHQMIYHFHRTWVKTGFYIFIPIYYNTRKILEKTFGFIRFLSKLGL